MMKRIVLCFLLIAFSTSVFSGVADDGAISTGEYDYGIIEWNSRNPSLVVEGGGQT